MRSLEIIRPWQYGQGLVNGRTPMLHTGIYRVPDDIAADRADAAVIAGVGVWLHAPKEQSAGVARRWEGRTVIVAAPGPSLNENVAAKCRGIHVIAVQDAWRLIPWADVLYGCDAAWWLHHNGVPEFGGQKWSTHDDATNDKRAAAEKFGLYLVAGVAAPGFSTDPAIIHYGSNSGFQAVNLAILFGVRRIILAGFDMRRAGGKAHFFGEHPKPLRRTTNFAGFIRDFGIAAQSMPEGVEIINATPDSALTCFPMMSLDDALSAAP